MMPLRTIHLAGYPLRIYASPLTVPDHPWASFHDLMMFAEMDEADQPRWLDKLQQELPNMVHVLLDGIVIVAEPMVDGMFLALDMMGSDDMQEMRDEWTEAWMELFAIQLAEMPVIRGSRRCAKPNCGIFRTCEGGQCCSDEEIERPQGRPGWQSPLDRGTENG